VRNPSPLAYYADRGFEPGSWTCPTLVAFHEVPCPAEAMRLSGLDLPKRLLFVEGVAVVPVSPGSGHLGIARPERQCSQKLVPGDPAPSQPSTAEAPPDGPRIARANDVVNELDSRHGQALFGLARRSGLADDAAEDAVQEALLRLWLEVRTGVEIIDPRAWTFRTLYRIAMDQHRLRRRAADLRDRLARRPPRVIDPDQAERLSVWMLVDRLPTRQRQVLYLRYKADMTFEQAAKVMGITASAARSHATFASVRLRDALGPEWADE